ncbi:MAG: aldolase/citrate lyase family protein, partial [Chloroflexota bacterium]
MSNQSIIAPNLVKRALRRGQTVLGTMVAEMRQPSVMQLLANAGFDFAIIDNEHGPFNIETIAILSQAAKGVGVTPLVRVPDLTYAHLAQALDAGAQGIMLPRVRSAAQVREAVQIMKYPPQGSRGCALNRGHTDFKSGPVAEAIAAANEETMLIVQVETRQALAELDEIVAVAGVDVILVGPTDLSISLGVPGELNHPAMQAAIEQVIAVCQ